MLTTTTDPLQCPRESISTPVYGLIVVGYLPESLSFVLMIIEETNGIAERKLIGQMAIDEWWSRNPERKLVILA